MFLCIPKSVLLIRVPDTIDPESISLLDPEPTPDP